MIKIEKKKLQTASDCKILFSSSSSFFDSRNIPKTGCLGMIGTWGMHRYQDARLEDNSLDDYEYINK